MSDRASERVSERSKKCGIQMPARFTLRHNCISLEANAADLLAVPQIFHAQPNSLIRFCMSCLVQCSDIFEHAPDFFLSSFRKQNVPLEWYVFAFQKVRNPDARAQSQNTFRYCQSQEDIDTLLRVPDILE